MAYVSEKRQKNFWFPGEVATSLEQVVEALRGRRCNCEGTHVAEAALRAFFQLPITQQHKLVARIVAGDVEALEEAEAEVGREAASAAVKAGDRQSRGATRRSGKKAQ